MLTSLSLIFLVGLAMGAICQKLKLPRIIGMLATGIVLGPYVLDLLDPSILSISSDLRKMALIIILLKAGLSLNLEDLKKVGRPAIMMSFVPASFEIVGYLLFAPAILGITRVEAAVMGSVLAAVSPAVVVPRMVQLMETKYGTEKAIPQMMIPELKLFMVTRSARGPMRTAIIPHTRHSLICFPSLVMSTARSRITTIFTSSAGWKRRDLVPSHLFLPLTAIPSGVNVTRISQI